MIRALTILLVLFSGTALQAQTAPSAAQVAGYTGLFHAAHTGDIATVRDLISQGVELEARDNSDRTAIHIAAFASNDDVLRALAEAGANMNALDNRAYDVVTIAAVADDPDLMSLAIELGNDPGLTTSPYDGTALIAAAHLGHVEVVKRLIAVGAPLDHVNNLHWTAVIEAVVLGDGGPDHQAVLDALLKAGADRELGDREGVTPLAHALARGYLDMADRLRQPD